MLPCIGNRVPEDGGISRCAATQINDISAMVSCIFDTSGNAEYIAHSRGGKNPYRHNTTIRSHQRDQARDEGTVSGDGRCRVGGYFVWIVVIAIEVPSVGIVHETVLVIVNAVAGDIAADTVIDPQMRSQRRMSSIDAGVNQGDNFAGTAGAKLSVVQSEQLDKQCSLCLIVGFQFSGYNLSAGEAHDRSRHWREEIIESGVLYI